MIKKYKRITTIILKIICFLICIFFADILILPQKKVDDVIVSYSENTVRRGSKYGKGSNEHFSYNFYTQKGLKFSTEKTYIEENSINIEYSYIFKNVTKVKSKTQDYSSKLTSDLNGVCFYLMIGLIISSIISLLVLRFNESLSENGFQNIILFNSLLAFYLIYLLIVFN